MSIIDLSSGAQSEDQIWSRAVGKGGKEAEAELQTGYRSFPAPREQTSGCGIVK